MTTERKFAAFGKAAIPPRMKRVPDGGLCISSFVVLSKPERPSAVLMGRINKSANWDHIGALDRKRAERISAGWMLPSSHLLLYETPEGAARRILREQLGLRDQKLSGPMTFADTSGRENHWDFGFIFLGERDSVPKSEAWLELKFIDLSTATSGEGIVRAQADVLAYAGKWNLHERIDA